MSPQDRPSKVFADIFPPREIRILGAGRFGSLAAEKTRRKFPEAAITITDTDAGKVERVSRALGITGEVNDSIRSITGQPPAGHVWVVPTVPVHVVFEWVLHELSKEKDAVTRLPVPAAAAPQVPNPIRSPAGTTIYSSFETFICPDFCAEPEEACTKSGKARIRNLFEVFAEIAIPEFTPVVLRSWQLAGGVGGYPVRSMKDLFETVAQRPGKYLVGTSCRCHGVLDALEWR
jgi:hypothetical protein